MIRTGFVNFSEGQSWLGGLHYVRNLLQAIASLEHRRIEPVLFAGETAGPGILAGLPIMPVVRSAMFDRMRVAWAWRKMLRLGSGKDVALGNLLARNRISVLSHSGHLGAGASIPSIGWIPDFQHRHLPELFSKPEFDLRERQIAETCALCTRVVVSSETAARDLRTFSPVNADRLRVLHFASGLLHGRPLPDRAELEARHGIDGPYLHVPNQFWVHKNHEILIAALELLQKQERFLSIVATGHMADPRRPEHMGRLLARLNRGGLARRFRTLGVIPYEDMLGLMRDAVAVINPSLFEGWSTSVEEAKSLGKQILVSDIAVHREQAAARATYFDPKDASAAAAAIWQVWSTYDRDEDDRAMQQAAAGLPARIQSFGRAYEAIVVDAAERGGA